MADTEEPDCYREPRMVSRMGDPGLEQPRMAKTVKSSIFSAKPPIFQKLLLKYIYSYNGLFFRQLFQKRAAPS